MDKSFWVVKAPDDMTYKLELLDEYNGPELDESVLALHGFNGGGSLEIPNCNNKVLIDYIKSVF